MKKCSYCKKTKPDVYRRFKENLQGSLLCESCYRKCQDICSLCQRHKEVYIYSKNNKPICKACETLPERKCKYCNKKIPAGRGWVCRDCSFYQILVKKISILNLLLTNYTNDIFEEFTWWLYNRRDIVFVSLNIQKYFSFFYQLDSLANTLKKFPNYMEILKKFTVAFTRKYLLVMNFLDEKNIINIDSITKDIFANLNIIDKYLNHFDSNTYESIIISKYNDYLFGKYHNKKTTIRSIRLALTPVLKLLSYKITYFKKHKLSNNIIIGYLWIYPGQTSALTGFINYLNRNYNYQLKPLEKRLIQLSRPNSSKKQLKLRLIKHIKKTQFSKYKISKYLKLSIEYLHNIKIPSNVFLSTDNLYLKDNKMFIRCCNHSFYIPDTIFLPINIKLIN